MGVVGGVDDDGRARCAGVRAARDAHRRERLADGGDVEPPRGPGAEEGLDGGEREGRVGRLVLAEQRQVDVVVLAAEALQAQLLAADGDLAAEHAELQPGARDLRADLDRALEQDRGDLGGLLRDSATAPSLMTPAFSRGDAGEVGAEVGDVVDVDRRDRGDRGVGDVGGVPAPAEPDLEHGDVDRGVGEGGEGEAGEHLELAQPRSVALGAVDDAEEGAISR